MIDWIADWGGPGTGPARGSRAARRGRGLGGGAGQGFEVERGEVALAGTPIRALLEELRAGQRHDEDRDVLTPLQEVVDEVEQTRVGVVEVLEHHRYGALLGDSV